MAHRSMPDTASHRRRRCASQTATRKGTSHARPAHTCRCSTPEWRHHPLFHRKMPAPVQRIQGTPVIDSGHEIGLTPATPQTQPKVLPAKTLVVDAAVHRRVRGSDTPSTGNREPTGWGGICNIRPTAAAFFTETPTRTDQITHTPGNLSPTRQPGAATLLTNPIIIASTDPCKHTTKQRHDTVQATTGPHSPPAPKHSATTTTTTVPKTTASRRIFRAAKQRNKRNNKQAAHHFLAAMTASPRLQLPAPHTPRPPMTEPQA